MSQLFTLKSLEKYRKQFLLISAGFPKVSITCVNRHPVLYRYGLRQNEKREKKRCVEDRQKRRNEDEPWLEMVEGCNDLTYIFSMMSFLPTKLFKQYIYTYIQLPMYFFQAAWKPRTVWDVYVVIAVNLHAASHDRYQGITIAVDFSVVWSPVMGVLTAWIGW